MVFWGLEPEEEKFFLDVIRPFEEDPLSEEAQVPFCRDCTEPPVARLSDASLHCLGVAQQRDAL